MAGGSITTLRIRTCDRRIVKIKFLLFKDTCAVMMPCSSKNLLDNLGLSSYYVTRAEVVELVDALRSGRSGSNPVGVRVPPSAPFSNTRLSAILSPFLSSIIVHLHLDEVCQK